MLLTRRGVSGPIDLSKEICGTYNRISDAAREKKRGTDESGVGRQASDTNGAVTTLGGVVFKRYMEDDTSAFKKKRILRFDPDTGRERYVYRVIRPVWQGALQDLRDGVITALMVDDLDRMARDMRDLEDAIEIVEYFNGLILGVHADVNLTTDGGRMAARVGVTMANKSSADTSRRVTRKHLALSTSGAPVGGPRPFGWNKDRLTLHPVESVHLRRWLDMALRGASWREIVENGHDNGVTGTRGKPMGKSSLRQLIFSPRNCQYRMFHGDLARDESGQPVVGKWEPICTPDEWLELTNERIVPRSQSTGVSRSAKYLLTGIVRCGVCKARMRGMRRRVGDKNYDSYACPPVAEGGHQCVARNMAEVDQLVTEIVMAAGKVKKGRAPVAHGWERQAALADAEERKEKYINDAARGKVTDAVLYKMLPIIEDEIKELQKIKAAWLRSRNQRMLATTAWDEKSWAKLTLTQKRTAVSALIMAVEISRTTQGVGRAFDASKVKVVWRSNE